MIVLIFPFSIFVPLKCLKNPLWKKWHVNLPLSRSSSFKQVRIFSISCVGILVRDCLLRSSGTNLDFSRLVQNLVESQSFLTSLISHMVFFFPCFVFLLLFNDLLFFLFNSLFGIIRFVFWLSRGLYVCEWGLLGLYSWRSSSTVPFCVSDCVGIRSFGGDSPSEVSGVSIASGGLYVARDVPLFFSNDQNWFRCLFLLVFRAS